VTLKAQSEECTNSAGSPKGEEILETLSDDLEAEYKVILVVEREGDVVFMRHLYEAEQLVDETMAAQELTSMELATGQIFAGAKRPHLDGEPRVEMRAKQFCLVGVFLRKGNFKRVWVRQMA
jgi:hypothetical protein